MGNTTRAELANASVNAADLASALYEALAGSGDDTGVPGKVVAVIDDALRELHQIRERAVVESRWRVDAAMARSAALLGKSHAPAGLTCVWRVTTLSIGWGLCSSAVNIRPVRLIL